MLPGYDKSTIQHVVEEAVTSGIEDIITVTAKHEKSRDHIDKHYEVEYNLQKTGKDSELKQIRKITDHANTCYIQQKKRTTWMKQ